MPYDMCSLSQASRHRPLVLTRELVDALRAALAQVTISGEPPPRALLSPQSEQQAANNYERVKEYLATHPHATDRAIADALAISNSTANKWRKRVERAGAEGEQYNCDVIDSPPHTRDGGRPTYGQHETTATSI